MHTRRLTRFVEIDVTNLLSSPVTPTPELPYPMDTDDAELILGLLEDFSLAKELHFRSCEERSNLVLAHSLGQMLSWEFEDEHAALVLKCDRQWRVVERLYFELLARHVNISKPVKANSARIA